MFKKFIIIAAVLFALVVTTLLATRQYTLHWGATQAEVESVMPGDELLPDSTMTSTRAIDINAPPEKVWPWLVQMGQGRGGFYSYDWLESLLGLDIKNVDRIAPRLQNLKKGDLIPFSKAGGIPVIEIKPGRLLVLAGTFVSPEKTVQHTTGQAMVGGTWVFELHRLKNQTSRLVVRSRVARFEPFWMSAVFMRLLEPVHFIMERKMLKGIKERAELVK